MKRHPHPATVSDIGVARAKKRSILERLRDGKPGHNVPVLNEDVAKESDNDCKECGGSGVVDLDEEAVCMCAGENFQRRRGHQVEMRKGILYWLPGCPRG